MMWTNLTKRNFKPLLEEAGLRRTVRFYDLRHTFATWMLE
jgi:integrase